MVFSGGCGDGKTQVQLEYVPRVDGGVQPSRVLMDGLFAAFLQHFSASVNWTLRPSGANAGSHPRCWATEFGA